MSQTIIILYLCLHGHCVHDTIPFNGTMWECSIGWQPAVIEYMQEFHPGYILRRASCIPGGVAL